MKKLYTLLLAAAVTLTAAAASPFQAKNVAVKNDIQFKEAATVAKPTIDLEKLGLTKEDVMTSISRADLPTLAEKFMLISSPDTMYTAFDAVPCTIVEVPAEPGNGFYIIKDFIMPGTNDIDADLTIETIGEGADAFDVCLLTIKSNTPLFTQNRVTYSLRLFGYSENDNGVVGPAVYPNDIQFILLNDGSFTFAYNGNMGIAYVSPQLSGSWILAPEMYVQNATMTGVEAIPNEQNQIEYEEISAEMWANYSAENNALLLANLANYERMMVLDVDLANATAIATNQPIATLYNNTGSFDAYLSSQPTALAPVTFYLSTVNGKTIIEQNQEEAAYIVVETASGVSPWHALGESKVTLDFEIPGLSGISNVTVADENAPVEYYNLQGVRVANPESGLYIKRQGNKATKVLVK